MSASRDFALSNKVFGFHLRKRRLAAGLSQANLALLSRTRQSIICRLERAERVPRIATLERIARVLEKAGK